MELVTIPIAFIKGLQERGLMDTWTRWIVIYGEKIKDPFFLQHLTKTEKPSPAQEKIFNQAYDYGKPFLQAILFARAKKTAKGVKIKMEQLSKTAEQVIIVLNAMAGTAYGRVNMGSAIKPVLKILELGYTKEDCAAVIRKKCAEWKGNEVMEQHLNPGTLFNVDKFDKYLNQPERHGGQRNQSGSGHFQQTTDAVGAAIEINNKTRTNQPGATDS